MKHTYLVLSIIGFASANVLMVLESIETGNILLYLDFMTTLQSMFANRIAAIFSIDLIVAVVVFFIWSYVESKKIGFKPFWTIWIVTMLFGLAGGFPLFLYFREITLSKQRARLSDLD